MGHSDWLRGRSVHFSTFILFCIIIILYISYYMSISKVSCAAQLFTLANTIKCCCYVYIERFLIIRSLQELFHTSSARHVLRVQKNTFLCVVPE